MMNAEGRARLLDQAREWVADGVVSPTISCADLTAQFQVDSAVAYAALADLDLVQRTIQAVCYARYINRLFSLNITADLLLSTWSAAPEGARGFMLYAIEYTGLYIGKTTQPAWTRWDGHRCLLRRNRHHCPKLQQAWNEYGESAFVFKVLQVVGCEAALDRAELEMIAGYRLQGATVYNTR